MSSFWAFLILGVVAGATASATVVVLVASLVLVSCAMVALASGIALVDVPPVFAWAFTAYNVGIILGVAGHAALRALRR